jgi:hypothetical protein
MAPAVGAAAISIKFVARMSAAICGISREAHPRMSLRSSGLRFEIRQDGETPIDA